MTSPLWQRSDGELLKTLREQTGLDRVVLARMGTMTVHQVRGLEEGEGGEFYSPEIKAHMGRTLLAKLGYVAPPAPPGAPAPQSPPPESLPEADPPSPRLAQAPPPPASPRGRSERGVWRIAALGVLVALTVGAYALVGPKPPRQPTAASAPAGAHVPDAPGVVATAVTPLAPPEVPAAAAPAPAPPAPAAAAPAAAVAADAGCTADAALSSVAYTPTEPRKAGNFVYVVADKPARLCVLDANRKATRVELEPGAGRSIYGAAPFVVRGDMGHLRIFFQGMRVQGELGTGTQMVLNEAPLR